MKKWIKWFLCVLLCVVGVWALPVLATTTWQSTGAPEGGRIWGIQVHPSNPQIIYAETAGGLYTSIDGGTSWSVISSLNTQEVPHLVIDPLNPQTMYAHAYSDGLFKSTDGGATWSNTPFSSLLLQALAIDPNNSQVLYVGERLNFYKSTDSSGML